MRYLKSLAALSFAVAATAQAATYEVSFSGEGYRTAFSSTVVDAPFTGKFTVEGADASIFGTGTVTAFDMVLGGHQYTLDNVLVLAYSYNSISVYGAVNGTDLQPRTNDFSLDIFAQETFETESGMMFAVPSSGRNVYYVVGFKHAVTPVPEATSVSLAVAGLGVAVIAARRRRA